jgi:long-chain acyl-CoA synthetase
VLAPLGGALDVIGSGGAMLSEELQRAWETFGVRIVQGYGTTECAVVSGHTRRRQRTGTTGPPMAGLEVRIAQDGELIVRGPNVMLGYWEAPAATAEVLDADGWFHTGDAARIDEHGEVVILGRTRDRISLPNGFNVYPEDVEMALVDTGAVRAAVVFETTPGRLAAALVPPAIGAGDEELGAAVKAANASLAAHQKVGTWRRWPDEDFPRTHTHKVRRGPVKEWFVEAMAGADDAPSPRPAESAGRPRSGTAAITVAAVAELIASVLAEARGGKPSIISGETTLDSLELDSLAIVSVALRLDETFDAPLSDDEVVGAHDIAALHALVVARHGQPPAAPPSDWAFSAPARGLRRLLDATFTGWAIGVTAGPDVEGAEHVAAAAGPVLICPNHVSHLDAPLIRAALPPEVRDWSALAAAADVWFEGGLVGPAVELALGAIPFGRTSDIRASLERVAELVNRGYSVVVFPEGTRSADGAMGPLRDGIGLLATSLRVPVVPAHIDGAHEILPKGATLPTHKLRSRVRVRFGEPLEFTPDTTVRGATDRVRQAIEALV